ncbi:MAG: PAS domain S-box protein [Nitrospirae bacterium]|nr:PAS domain S-box protein [Nitrospirota bacterium]
MAKKSGKSRKTTELRRQAEELLRATKREVAAMPLKDVQQLVYGLRIREIELEMQNKELRRAEDALRLAKFSMERAADAVYWIDPQAKVLDANEAASLMLGYSKEELCAMTVHDLNPDFQANMWPGFWAETQRHGTMVFETAHRAKNGRLVPIEVSVNYLSYGGKEYHCAFVRDITKRKQAQAALRSSELFLDSIVENIPDMIFVKDAQQLKFVRLNRAGEELLGRARTELIGKSDYDFFPKEEADFFTGKDQEVLRDGHFLDIPEEPILTKGKGPRFLHTKKIPLFDEMGHPQYLLGISEDITERKRTEEALQASEIFSRSVLNSLSALICVLGKDGIILKTNDAWKEFSCRNSNRLVPPIDSGENYLDLCRRAIADGDPAAQAIVEGIEIVLRGSQPIYSSEYACLSSEKEQWFLMRVTPLKESKGVVVSHTDISERVQMGRELENHARLLGEKQEELESLTGKLIEAREQECKRIARELHDDFNQRLAALSVELENLERSPVAPPVSIARQLAVIRGQMVQLSDDLHDLAYRLHPSLLDHVGLEAAVRDHIAEFTKRTGLPVRFTAREVPMRLSPEIATNLFRVVQESLQNVSKHAKATDVTVKLSGSSKGIGVSVRDDGKGFDLGDKSARLKGLGLVSMEERTHGLGGFLRIHSFEMGGTKVCAWIPLAPEGA